MKDKINFVEWDEKHKHVLIRLTGEDNINDYQPRIDKMCAGEDMYEALKLSLLLSEQPLLQGNADVQILTNTIKQALSKAEGKE